ncbi:MAG: signal recognition particle-docking protein FtsY, partial [Pseudomonadota bacterium]
ETGAPAVATPEAAPPENEPIAKAPEESAPDKTSDNGLETRSAETQTEPPVNEAPAATVSSSTAPNALPPQGAQEPAPAPPQKLSFDPATSVAPSPSYTDLEKAPLAGEAPSIADPETPANAPDIKAQTPETEDASAPSDALDQATAEPQKKRGFFGRLKDGLAKTSGRLSEGVTSIFTKRKLDDDTLEELEDLLITADLGVAAASRITERLAKDRYNKEITDTEVKAALADEVAATLSALEKPLDASTGKPHVILMTGVNGAGKTTTIGKLSEKYRREGKSVIIAAGDTFRAAAIEQLSVWGERTGAKVIARDQGADAAGLAFDALREAQETGADVLLIDTAGRLQNKSELMDELAKIIRVVKKLEPQAPHDTVLVLDATVGQNALSQAEAFKDIAGASGLIMTKLDGKARGGVLVALAEKHQLPIHYIGVGEGVDDLQPFNAHDFARALSGAA